MRRSIYQKMLELDHLEEMYAMVQVVRRKIPSSGKPGDKAIITKDGQITGWIGGGCTQGIALKEALSSLHDGKPRFVRISPERIEDDMPGTKHYAMTCQSGGSVDLYIEPIITKPKLLIIGRSHIGIALAKMASQLEYPITAVASEIASHEYEVVPQKFDFSEFNPDSISSNTYVVVCTQGNGDDIGLDLALKTKSKHIALVSSRMKANALFGNLRKMGYSFDDLKRIKTPAGLDIHAKMPEEVAISILAEIIQDYRSPESPENVEIEAEEIQEQYYLNPVCGLPIQKSTAKHVINYKDHHVYFCCDGCKDSFEKEPEKYIS